MIIVYVTHETETKAQAMAEALIKKKLIACANIFPIKSCYFWQGELQNDDEWVSILKSTDQNWIKLEAAISEIHPYEVPCIMKIQVTANAAYEKWIAEQLISKSEVRNKK